MSDSTFAQVAAFNTKLHGIVELLLKRFPSDRNISFTRSKVELAQKTNSKLPALHFMREITDHLSQLEARDDQFFLTLVQNKYDDALASLDIPHKWSCLTDEDKEYLWTTTQTLAKLGQKIVEKYV